MKPKFKFSNVTKKLTSSFVTIKNTFKYFFIHTKTKLWCTIGLFVSHTCLTSFFLILGACVPLNKTQSLVNVIEKYRLQQMTNENIYNDAMPGALIYYNKLTHYEYIVYNKTETTIEFRNLYGNFANGQQRRIFNLYPAKWLGRYSPGVIQYPNNEKDEDITFLLWPKPTSTTHNFLYNDLPLKYGNVSSFGSPNDIYINERYANRLKAEKNLISIDDLLKQNNNSIEIFYRYNLQGSQKSRLIPVTYNIKGIIDSKSPGYQKYYARFGEFFVANEYLTLPIPVTTYFEINNNKRDNIQILNTVLKLYQYTTLRAYDSNAHKFSDCFDTRVTFFSDYTTPNKISVIGTNELSRYNKMTDEIFDFYNLGLSLTYSIIFGVLTVYFMILDFFLIMKLVKKSYDGLGTYAFSYNKHKLFLTSFLLIMIATMLGISLGSLFISLQPAMASISAYTVVGSLLIIIACYLPSIIIVGTIKNKSPQIAIDFS